MLPPIIQPGHAPPASAAAALSQLAALPHLEVLHLGRMISFLARSIPEEWFQPHAFPRLTS
jgi:hypothetical protein